MNSRAARLYGRWLMAVLAPFTILLVVILIWPSVGDWVEDYQTLVSAFVGLASVIAAVIATGRISAENEKRKVAEAQLSVALRIWAELRNLLEYTDIYTVLSRAEKLQVDRIPALATFFHRLRTRRELDLLSFAQHPAEMSGQMTISLVRTQSRLRDLFGEQTEFDFDQQSWVKWAVDNPDMLDQEIFLYEEACRMIEKLSVFVETEIEKLAKALDLPPFKNDFEIVRDGESWRETNRIFPAQEDTKTGSRTELGN